MNEKIQTQEFSLMDLLRVLWSKIKILILVLICGGIVGGGLGVITSYNEKYYGTNLEFYVNPEAPAAGSGSQVTSQSTYGVYGAYGRHVMDNIVKLLSSEFFAEELMVGMPNAPTEKHIIDKNGKKYINPEYRTYLNKIREAVNFQYLEEEVDLDDAVNLARSFIYVDVSVLGDGNIEFAESLLARIREEVPEYVKKNMIVPDGYVGTNCIEITTISEIGRTNPGHRANTAIKYALLVGAAALVVACVVVIVIDRSDKRVRDYDQVSRQLQVPLLGVIPSINDEKITAWNEAMKEGQVD
jgi:capsular polysaccharide biosynthesis protein